MGSKTATQSNMLPPSSKQVQQFKNFTEQRQMTLVSVDLQKEEKLAKNEALKGRRAAVNKWMKKTEKLDPEAFDYQKDQPQLPYRVRTE